MRIVKTTQILFGRKLNPNPDCSECNKPATHRIVFFEESKVVALCDKCLDRLTQKLKKFEVDKTSAC